MTACEKCWSDSYGDAAEYQRRISERNAQQHRCTPEEQAGPDATVCPTCGRRAVHQYAKVCMACHGQASGEEE